MLNEAADRWYLRKHDNGELFGPVQLEKVKEWAASAQIAPQDMLSNDKENWTKAPMAARLEMDWIVDLGGEAYYGPTTAGTLLEFYKNKEIAGETTVIDCLNGTTHKFKELPFFPSPTITPEAEDLVVPTRGVIRLSLQKRIRDLEMSLLEKRRQLDLANETISRLEHRVRDLESRIRDISGFGLGT